MKSKSHINYTREKKENLQSYRTTHVMLSISCSSGQGPSLATTTALGRPSLVTAKVRLHRHISLIVLGRLLASTGRLLLVEAAVHAVKVSPDRNRFGQSRFCRGRAHVLLPRDGQNSAEATPVQLLGKQVLVQVGLRVLLFTFLVQFVRVEQEGVGQVLAVASVAAGATSVASNRSRWVLLGG